MSFTFKCFYCVSSGPISLDVFFLSVKTIRTCQPQPSGGGMSSASRSAKSDGLHFSNKVQLLIMDVLTILVVSYGKISSLVLVIFYGRSYFLIFVLIKSINSWWVL